jgi:hypothetical protein
MTDVLKNNRYKEVLTKLATVNRHLNSMVIISCHKYHQLFPIIRANANLLILFKGFAKEKIRDIYDDCNNKGIDFDTFYKTY